MDEDQLSAIIGDPEKMQKIMALAQSFQESTPADSPEVPPAVLDGIDPNIIVKLTKLASRNGIDKNQQELLHALTPYLRQERLQKLESAMRAAKLAGLATMLLGGQDIHV